MKANQTDHARTRMAIVTLLMYTLFLQVFSIWGGELSSRDAPRVAGIAREMAVTSNYFVPRLNGQPFLEYPSLGYVPVALFISASDQPSDFLALLPMALIGTGTVLLTFLIGRNLEGTGVGLAAGFFLATTSGFLVLHRRCLVDPTLVFFIVLSLYGFTAGYKTGQRDSGGFSLFYLGMAGGFLSKGLIGILLPGATVLLFLVLRKDIAAVAKMGIGWGVPLLLFPVFLWVAGVYWMEGAPADIFLQVVEQSLWRFVSASADHAAPFYFYVGPTFINLLPWVIVPFALIWICRGSSGWRTVLQRPLAQFGFAWFVTVFVGLSLASAKRILYLGPIYPAFALLAALSWDLIRTRVPGVKLVEIPGLMGMTAIYLYLHFFVWLPAEKLENLRPLFEVANNQGKNGQIYLCDAQEVLRGAAFFYLGKPLPEIRSEEWLTRPTEIPQSSTMLVNLSRDDNRVIGWIESAGFQMLKEQVVGNSRFRVYRRPS